VRHFDVFNGDADGICSLHQLRLAAPVDSILISGPKRDIALLQRVDAQAGDRVTALDISAATNRPALIALLERGVEVTYFDHHFAGELPVHPNLTAVIDPSPSMCTSMLVDRHLAGRHRIWAVVGAFGDNLAREARLLARDLALDDGRLAQLRALGESLAYAGYGDAESDLVVPPVELYRRVHAHADPFGFIGTDPLFRTLDESRRDDLQRARECRPEAAPDGAVVYMLPDAAWSRRVRGVFANELAQLDRRRAHAVLTPDDRDGYVVSVRAPLDRNSGADALCRRFPSGSGRAAAAGINHLPRSRLEEFTRALGEAYPRPP
jgi:single-stranded DNA-specific DHH superfamily exonuclease